MSKPKGYVDLSIEKREFRLLTLLPALSSSSTIKCELSIASFNTPPPYEALSYVWGNPANPEHIELDKIKFPVTQNLHAALKALRRRTSKYVLWVDALCINQQNIPERNSQVSQMRFIYELASQVAVWLGNATPGSPLAFSLLKAFAAQRPENLEGWLNNMCIGCSSTQTQQWQELALLLSRPYWTRAWIYQEMILPSRATIYCGKDSISWDDLTTVTFAIDTHENLLRMIEPPANDPRVVGIYHPVYNATLARSNRKTAGFLATPLLLDALCTQRYSDATDPKDKVFSLLGVTKNFFIGLPEMPEGPDVAIDYNRSLADVYKGVVRHIVKRTRNLDILCACQNPEREKGIPSWAPDWSTKRSNGPIQNPDQWGHIHFACQENSVVWWTEPPDENTLAVNGVYMDTITQVGNPHTYGCDWEELKMNWQSLAMTCAWDFSGTGTGPCYITTESIPQAFFETLTVGRIDDEVGGEPEDLLKVELARIEAIERRRFFVTEKGFMGLGPEQAKSGDRVVCIQGVHVPMILRADEDGAGHAVVGESYVHGLNNGEAFNEDMRDGFEENLARRLKDEKFLLK